MTGAGGTEGGVLRFFIGLGMLITGGYLFLNSIYVHSGFGWGYGLYRVGGFGITSGMILIPFILGIGMVFYNARNIFGWILSVGSLVALSVGVIVATSFRMRPMSAFDLITILVLGVGGLGILLSSLRNFSRD